MKTGSIILAIVAFAVGLRAAHLWYRASRVQVVPMWAQDGRIEPVDPSRAQAEWIVARRIAQSRRNTRVADLTSPPAPIPRSGFVQRPEARPTKSASRPINGGWPSSLPAFGRRDRMNFCRS